MFTPSTAQVDCSSKIGEVSEEAHTNCRCQNREAQAIPKAERTDDSESVKDWPGRKTQNTVTDVAAGTGS
ncbi:unnamed protein product [Rangifer tarandus platyrhynchus]|uniref:Uncharacterized protein n=2 Tax=Rangifer tarandus platyrhynchus TaxID=3082113 RepID=A0ACB0E3Z5_RANTA|nr:unnamed protein product [Rangifer tarandus platyrhynchus]CAI9695216.1 unnamed protein product [Rangifer tarandus platyrhynchus]